MLAIDHKVPKVLTLKQMLQKDVEFQDEVVRRRTQYDLKKAKERAHILEGLKKACLLYTSPCSRSSRRRTCRRRAGWCKRQ